MVSEILVDIGLGDGLLPVWHQTINDTCVDLLSFGLLVLNINETW